MPILAKQAISDMANKHILAECERLNCTKAEVVRRILDTDVMRTKEINLTSKSKAV